jgi:hypothetical protein
MAWPYGTSLFVTGARGISTQRSPVTVTLSPISVVLPRGRDCRQFQQVAERASYHGERGIIRSVAGQGLEVIKGCPGGH